MGVFTGAFAQSEAGRSTVTVPSTKLRRTIRAREYSPSSARAQSEATQLETTIRAIGRQNLVVFITPPSGLNFQWHHSTPLDAKKQSQQVRLSGGQSESAIPSVAQPPVFEALRPFRYIAQESRTEVILNCALY